jgi:hypothetical protein
MSEKQDAGQTKMAEKQFAGQHDGEVVQMLFRQHPLVMRKALILGLVVILVGVLPLDFYGLWYTNESLYSVLVKVDEWQLEGINNLNYHIGGFQAVLFGFGDITARTYMGDLEMKTIHKPAEVHAKLMTLVRKAGGASGSTRSPN